MEPKRRRRFTVLDALILIAAIGVGLAWMRQFTGTEAGGESYPYEEDFDGRPIPSFVLAVKIGFWWVDASYNLVAAVTIAMILLRGLSPRPKFRRLTRQPGAVACVAVTVALAVEMILKFDSVVELGLYGGLPWSKIGSMVYWNIEGQSESLAVMIAWLVLGLSGRWKSEASWVDRFGRVLGGFWLVAMPLNWLIQRIIIHAFWHV